MPCGKGSGFRWLKLTHVNQLKFRVQELRLDLRFRHYGFDVKVLNQGFDLRFWKLRLKFRVSN